MYACRLDSGWGVLLDAGEGAWGGLVRMYGHKVAQQEVSQLMRLPQLAGFY